MSWYRSQVEFERDSGAVADRSVVTFHFASDDVGTQAQELLDIHQSITQWVLAIDVYLSSEVSGGFGQVKYYDLEDPTPRVPLDTKPIVGLVAGATGGMPSQIAVPIGYEAAFVSGANRQRRRGRVYLGPLMDITADGVGDRTILESAKDAIGVASATLLVTPVPGTSSGSAITACVFSRRDAYDAMGRPYSAPDTQYTVAALNAGFHNIERVVMGDLFGVQRRRRLARPATRETYT